jgi:hypothetical protein
MFQNPFTFRDLVFSSTIGKLLDTPKGRAGVRLLQLLVGTLFHSPICQHVSKKPLLHTSHYFCSGKLVKVEFSNSLPNSSPFVSSIAKFRVSFFCFLFLFLNVHLY